MLSIGLMTGTSMDGIDAALLETDGEGIIVALGHTKINYAPETKHLLKAAERSIKNARGSLEQSSVCFLQELQAYLTHELMLSDNLAKSEINLLGAFLEVQTEATSLSLEAVIYHSTQLHAKAVAQLLNQSKKQASEIDIIGYHGQTMYHNPSQNLSIQIGDGKLLAELCNIPVINDFRQCDVAAGGQGAPLAPIYHQALALRDRKIPLAVVNCGGIANITLVPNDKLDSLIGFDTGPGNGLVDALVRKRTGGKETMDFNGQYGRQGTVSQRVLQALYEHAIQKNGHNYFLQLPPKSLDIRDMTLIPELDTLNLYDACATLEAFTADMIVKSLKLVPFTDDVLPRHWILAGGGWYNPIIKRELIHRLQAVLGDDIIVETADETGWHSDAMEAQIFAHLAVRSLKKLPLSLPGTTQTPEPLSGGRFYLPPSGQTTPAVAAWLSASPDILD